MNLASILVAAAIAGLLFLAVRYVAKHGLCAACEDREACKRSVPSGSGGKPPAGREPPASFCGGSCHSCPYYAQERRMKTAAVPVEKRTGR